MKTAITIVLLFFCIQGGFSQSFGYLGKKNLFSTDLRLSNPLLSDLWLRDDIRVRVEVGKSLSYMRILTPKFAMGIGLDLFTYDLQAFSSMNRNDVEVPGDEYGNDYIRYDYRDLPSLKVKRKMVTTIIEWSRKGGTMPDGLTFQMNMGIGTSRPIANNQVFTATPSYDYYSEPNPSESGETKVKLKDAYDFEQKPIGVFSLSLRPMYRIPLNDFMLFNIGFQYSLSYVREFFFNIKDDVHAEDHINRLEMINEIGRREFYTAHSLVLGLTFAL